MARRRDSEAKKDSPAANPPQSRPSKPASKGKPELPPDWLDPLDGTGASVHWAIAHDRLDLLDQLLQAGADPEAIEEAGEETALLAATRLGHLGMIARLLAAGANTVAEDEAGQSAIMVAARAGHRAAVALLAPATTPDERTRAEATLRAVTTQNGRSAKGKATKALIDAAKKGRVAEAQAAIAAGADVNALDPDGLGPLHYAAQQGKRLGLARALLAAGADPGLVGEGDVRPVFYARVPEMFELLVTAGADPNARLDNGFSLLHSVAATGSLDPVVTYLKLGCDLEARDHEGRTPLHSAVIHGRHLAFIRLAELGADINARNNAGVTPLEDARRAFGAGPARQDFQEIKVALRAAGRIDGQADALVAAAALGERDAVVDLLAAGVPVDARGDLPDRHGLTALYAAAAGGHDDLVRLLLKAGADARLRTTLDCVDPSRRKSDATPAMGAAHFGHSELAQWLEAAENPG